MKLSSRSKLFVKLILFVTIITLCNNNLSYNSISSEKIIANQLFDKEIILLADFNHGNYSSYNSLLMILYEWLEIVKTSPNKSRNLVLFLEMGKKFVDKLNEYISSNDMEILIDYLLPLGTLEDLEFFEKLREFLHEINLVNENLNIKINFEPIGPEYYSLWDTLYLSKSIEEIDLYFLYQRDSIVADNIVSFLNCNDNYSAIVFYGNAHLKDNYTSKNEFISTGSLKSKRSYYLGYYLKKFFGDEEVITINQFPFQTQSEHKMFENKNYNFIVDSKEVLLDELQPQYYDKFHFINEDFYPSHPLAKIFSRTIIQKSLNKLGLLENINGYKSSFYRVFILQNLFFLTGKRFRTFNEWNNWFYNDDEYDGFKRIESEEYKAFLSEYFYSDPNSYDARLLFVEFGFSKEFLNRKYFPSQDEWSSSILSRNLNRVKILNAVAMNYLGTEYEKNVAYKILQRIVSYLENKNEYNLEKYRADFP